MKEGKRTSISAKGSTVEQLRELAYLRSKKEGKRVSQESIVENLIRKALDATIRAKTEEEKEELIRKALDDTLRANIKSIKKEE